MRRRQRVADALPWSNSLWAVILKSASCQTAAGDEVGISHVAAFNKLSERRPKCIKRKYDHGSHMQCISTWKERWWHAWSTKRGESKGRLQRGQWHGCKKWSVGLITVSGWRSGEKLVERRGGGGGSGESDRYGAARWISVSHLCRKSAGHSKPGFPDRTCSLILQVHNQGRTESEPRGPRCVTCRVFSHWRVHPILGRYLLEMWRVIKKKRKAKWQIFYHFLMVLLTVGGSCRQFSCIALQQV